jgi:hypothetical protein
MFRVSSQYGIADRKSFALSLLKTLKTVDYFLFLLQRRKTTE